MQNAVENTLCEIKPDGDDLVLVAGSRVGGGGAHPREGGRPHRDRTGLFDRTDGADLIVVALRG